MKQSIFIRHILVCLLVSVALVNVRSEVELSAPYEHNRINTVWNGSMRLTGERRRISLPMDHMGELYGDVSFYEKDRNNIIAQFQVKEGMKMVNIMGRIIDCYLKVSGTKDKNKDFWNNKAEVGLGVRTRFFTKIYFGLYAEYLRGFYIDVQGRDPNPYDQNYVDLRCGAILWYAWGGRAVSDTGGVSFPLVHWGELYADGSLYRKDRHNAIANMYVKDGFRIMTLNRVVVDSYLRLNLAKDRNKDFWNNKAELGPGIRIKPFHSFYLEVYFEYVRGFYLGIEGRDPNPYDMNYGDIRYGLILWSGW